MTQGPEGLKQNLSGVTPEGNDRGGLGYRATDVAPETKPNILPLVDYRLISVPAEAERRASLLSKVSVDTKGVAHCLDERSATETLLVPVCINDKKDATLVPLVRGDIDQLRLILPSDRPSRIGFFVGYSSLQEISAVLRMGLYPGVPLTTQTISDNKTAEVMYGLGGIKASETEEQKWADQVGLYTALGFEPMRSRGMFNKNHRPNPVSDKWQESPLIVMPGDLLDMVRHYNPNDVKKDEFQVQFYGIKPPQPPQPFKNSDLFLEYSGRGLKVDFEQPLLSYRNADTRRELGIGFGEAVSRTAQTRATNIDSLRGAFNIIVIPQ